MRKIGENKDFTHSLFKIKKNDHKLRLVGFYR